MENGAHHEVLCTVLPGSSARLAAVGRAYAVPRAAVRGWHGDPDIDRTGTAGSPRRPVESARHVRLVGVPARAVRRDGAREHALGAARRDGAPRPDPLLG